ncbi:Protein SHC-2 c, partial [Aphelenchoides avenae]
AFHCNTLSSLNSTPLKARDPPDTPLRAPPKKKPALVFDERIREFVYPIEEELEELQALAYFSRNPKKDEVLRVLAEKPIVSAYLKRRTQDGIAHYLVIHGENGYRIKGSKRLFHSLPILITHHTVLPEQLPCRLVFTDWDDAILRGHPKDASRATSVQTPSSRPAESPVESGLLLDASTHSESSAATAVAVKLRRRQSSSVRSSGVLSGVGVGEPVRV